MEGLGVRDIPSTLAERPDLRAAMKTLLAQHEIPVKVTEGGDLRDRRKAILGALFGGETTLEQAIAETDIRLSRGDSPYRDNNLVFANGWAMRLVHTHTSLFWAALDALIAGGAPRYFVRHGSAEAVTSTCSRLLAGRDHDAAVLRAPLMQCYVHKRPMRVPLVPNHSHCTHSWPRSSKGGKVRLRVTSTRRIASRRSAHILRPMRSAPDTGGKLG